VIFCHNAADAKRDRWPTVAITASEALSIIVCAARIISPSSALSFVVSNLGYNDTVCRRPPMTEATVRKQGFAANAIPSSVCDCKA
jgi:hypothetical protein